LLEHTLLCHDKLAPFTDLVLACFDEFDRSPAQIVTFAATAKPSDYARYAPLIVEAAKNNDATGLMLMRRGADYLARALNVLEFCSEDVLCLTGGLAPHYKSYLPIVAQNAVVPARGTGLDGAIRLARDAAQKRGRAS
jgi:glucosamine kinase